MKPTEGRSISSLTKKYVVMNVQFPHKWWSTQKYAVFGSSLLLPSIVGEGGNLCASQLVRLICYQTKEDIDIEQLLYEIVKGKNFALNCLS